MINAAKFESTFHAIPHERTIQLLDRSVLQAERLRHPYIGTEHLFLGYLDSEEDAYPLMQLGISLPTVRSLVDFIVVRGNQIIAQEQLDFTQRALKVMQLSVIEASTLKAASVEPGHILLGLINEREGIAAGILESLEVSAHKMRVEMFYAR